MDGIDCVLRSCIVFCNLLCHLVFPIIASCLPQSEYIMLFISFFLRSFAVVYGNKETAVSPTSVYLGQYHGWITRIGMSGSWGMYIFSFEINC